MTDEIKKLRNEIDKIDNELVSLLSKRLKIVEQVGKLKKRHDIPTLDSKRLEEVLHSKKERAKLLGVSETFIEKLFQLIHDHSVKLQKKG